MFKLSKRSTEPTPRSIQRTLLPLGIGTAVSLLGDSTLYTVLPRPQIASQVGVTLVMVGVLLGANRVARMLSNPIADTLYDRYPRRPLLLGSLFLGVISTVIFAIGSGFGPLMLGRILWGVAWSGLWIGGNTAILDIASDANRGRLSGRFQMWFFLGVGVSAFLGGVFTDVFGFRGGLWISAGIMTSALLLWILFLPETRSKDQQVDLRRESKVTSSFPWKDVITIAAPLFSARFSFAGVLASTSILWLTDFFGDGLSFASLFLPIATLTGAFVSLRMVASVIGAPLAGFLSDRAGQRWHIMVAALVLGAIGMWLMWSPSLVFALPAAFIAAVAGGAVQSLVPAIAGDEIHATQRARALGTIYTLGDFGSALGPPLALMLVTYLQVGTIYRICAGLFATVSLIVLFQIYNSAQK
jgi:MFS family permease